MILTICMTGSMKNPFLIYGYEDPAHYCDREEETADIISALRNGRNISLIAPRRMGKTGLIHNVFQRIKQTDPSAACFYVDIFATKTLDDFKGSGDMSLSLLTDEHTVCADGNGNLMFFGDCLSKYC